VDVLVNEVEVNRAILFGKLSMQLTAAMKKKCCKGIAEKVNGVGASEVRTEKSMRKKWTDLTSRTKKVEAARRRELSATGGGECSYAAVSGVEAKIVEMMGSSVIYVNYNYNENRKITLKNRPLTITKTITKQ